MLVYVSARCGFRGEGFGRFVIGLELPDFFSSVTRQDVGDSPPEFSVDFCRVTFCRNIQENS